MIQNPKGVQAISRGLSVATPPDDVEKNHDPGGVAETYLEAKCKPWNSTTQAIFVQNSYDPSGVDCLLLPPSGGVVTPTPG